MLDVKVLSNGRRATGGTERSFYSNPGNLQVLQHGSNSSSLQLGGPLWLVEKQDLTKTNTERYKLHPILFRYLQSHFEEIFGASLICDPFANSENTSLVSCASRLVVNNCYLVVWDPQELSEVFSLVARSSIIALFVVPDWPTHDWHKSLTARSSHRFILPVGAVNPCWSDTCSTSAYILDSRYASRASDLVTTHVPEMEKLTLKAWPPPPAAESFPSSPKRCQVSSQVAMVFEMGEGLPNKMWLNTLVGIKDGVPTYYRGRGDLLRDYSSLLLPLEEEKAIEKAKESVAKGWALGPFERVPFPNFSSPMQAIVTKLFTIPKHKWINDGALRLIFHKSFPRGESINSITPRHDAASYFPKGKFFYLTLARLLAIITKAGKNCFIITFDANGRLQTVGCEAGGSFSASV